jgi:predicted SAM-dependent methyltransferase
MPRKKAERPALPLALPPAYDFDIYVNHSRNQDIAAANQDHAWAHYVHHGLPQGRVSGPVESRGHFAALVPHDAAILEVGPGGSPVYRRPEFNVRYLDVMDTAALRAVAPSMPWVDATNLPEIDFVWRGQRYRQLTAERFDVAFSSHAVEHQPCLIRHLNDVADVLRPRGWYFLIVPDKRYCFDHFLPETTLGDVLEAHLEGRIRHSPRHILEHRLMAAHNEAELHWDNNHGPNPRRVDDAAEQGARLRQYLAELTGPEADYVDAHAWRFTPDAFHHTIAVLGQAGLTRFTVERVYPTMRPSFEFFAVLRRVD